jgi:hypothetical protein
MTAQMKQKKKENKQKKSAFFSMKDRSNSFRSSGFMTDFVRFFFRFFFAFFAPSHFTGVRSLLVSGFFLKQNVDLIGCRILALTSLVLQGVCVNFLVAQLP